ncbi:hypothetical protein [Nostoc sp. FACHB-133]|uniref:hypothetical protein n=1 Tax=Nostoc sp. FACHB-133 TaxID=2692835 RepID=UPI001684D2DA|nr:hypothetical protein [Nostoc sp. FACHB-133]MBD2525684.1 hypothetical protein [Nostoc sp. FACHB-133]
MAAMPAVLASRSTFFALCLIPYAIAVNSRVSLVLLAFIQYLVSISKFFNCKLRIGITLPPN